MGDMSPTFYGSEREWIAATTARSRDFGSQGAELLIRCGALNRMMYLGMPSSYAS
jgi:hypothetical protein